MCKFSVLVAAALLSSCADLTQRDVEVLKEVHAAGVDIEAEGGRSPTAATLLNFLPGLGYLHNRQVGGFAASFMLWPVSILWAPANGASQAHVLNMRDTAEYYRSVEGARHLESVRAGRASPGGKSPNKVRGEAAAKDANEWFPGTAIRERITGE